MRLGRIIATATLAACLGTPAAADSWPSKPVRIVTGFAPGGPTELLGRFLGDHLSKTLGQPFVVEGKPGAAGIVAGEFVANAAPDGHTIGIVGISLITVNRFLYKSMTYDPMEVFAPFSLLVRFPAVLVVSTQVPPTTYDDFVRWAKTPGLKLNHGSPGTGTLPHLAAEFWRTKMGIASEHIAYRGSGPYVQGMMQKELQWSFDTPNTAIQLRDGGHVRFFAVTSRERWPAFPEVPTLGELGFPDAVWNAWFGLVVPAKTPPEIVARLSAEVRRGYTAPEYATRLKAAGFEPAPTTPEETRRIFADDLERWGGVVRAANIKVE
ncbi:MAG: tripartite tricarboxylate transporter substrate binding protein [Alphaproteobacteria bacterium]|nr:tripartite tricarboxylate transporter substrate binding protein [Alphaproteobacteria bacterium]